MERSGFTKEQIIKVLNLQRKLFNPGSDLRNCANSGDNTCFLIKLKGVIARTDPNPPTFKIVVK